MAANKKPKSFTWLVDAFRNRVNILVVDDDTTVLQSVSELLRSPLFNVTTMSRSPDARKCMKQTTSLWHCWVLDIAIEDEDSGLQLLSETNLRYPFVIVLSGMRSMATAAKATRLGAIQVFDKDPTALDAIHDYICKTAALGFVLKGKGTKNFGVYKNLLETRITTIEQWAEKAYLTRRQLERVCEFECSLSPRYVLSLFHAVQYLLLDFGTTLPPSAHTFFRPHVDFVYNHSDKIL